MGAVDYDYIRILERGIALRVAAELKDAAPDELKQIVERREAMPWGRRLVRSFDPFGMYFEENMRYLYARDTIDGRSTAI